MLRRTPRFNPTRAPRRFALFIGLLCAATLAGCGGDNEVYAPSGVVAGGPDAGPANDAQPGDFRYLILPLHDVSMPEPVEVGGEVQLFAQIIDLEAGAPAAGVPVSFSLRQTAPDESELAGDASLNVTTGISDREGHVTVIVRAGSVPLVSYLADFGTSGALTKSVPVAVLAEPRGDLRVRMAYEGPITLKTVRVHLVEGSQNCTTFKPENPPGPPLDLRTVVGTQSRALFDGLLASRRYGIYVTATTEVDGEGEHLAAGGCVDAVFVDADRTTDATVRLHLAPLKLAGIYRVEGLYNFTQVAVDFLNEQGIAGQVLADVITFFIDPGEVIVDYVALALEQVLPGIVVDVLDSFLGDLIGDALSNWLLDIPALQDFWTIGQDITGVVSRMELISELSFSKVHSDFTLNGREDFIGLALRWRFGCDPAAPDYADCGRYPFTLEDFGVPGFPLDVLSAHFTASLINWNVLHIDPHILKLNYGKLILFALQGIILPAIADGETTLSGAFKKLVNCDGLGGIGGFAETQVRDACNAAMGLIGNFIEATIGGLRWDSNISLSGSCTVIDDDDNLTVERLINGRLDGTVVISGATTSPLTATFDGERK